MSAPAPEPGIDDTTLRAAKVLWDYHCIYSPLQPATAIAGLGSYDLRVAERCATLFHAGLADKIIFTGASGHWTSGLYRGSEAAAFAAVARSDGVPDDAIALEERATNIGENIRFSSVAFDPDDTVIFVTKPQTQRRCRATVVKQLPDLDARVTAPEHGFLDQPTEIVPIRALICEMVGDLRRMEIYPELGFQAVEHIPPDVRDAYGHLVEAGFTDHLPDA